MSHKCFRQLKFHQIDSPDYHFAEFLYQSTWKAWAIQRRPQNCPTPLKLNLSSKKIYKSKLIFVAGCRVLLRIHQGKLRTHQRKRWPCIALQWGRGSGGARHLWGLHPAGVRGAGMQLCKRYTLEDFLLDSLSVFNDLGCVFAYEYSTFALSFTRLCDLSFFC